MKVKKKIKKKIIGGVSVTAIVVVVVAGLFVPGAVSKIKEEDVITASQLEKVININDLATAEFIYDGIADKYNEKKPDKVECHIAYESTIKVGIDMDKVKFSIDEKNKTVTPELPEVKINGVAVDTKTLSYMPENPKIEINDIIALCKKDALKEAGEAPELYQTAEKNLQSAIEVLLSPILKTAGYTLMWECNQ